MNDLKNYLKENKAAFDSQEPADGHFERFEERLKAVSKEKKRKRTLKIRLISTFSVAASILLIIGISIHFHASPVDTGDPFAEQTANEFSLTNDFYKEQMNEQIAGIQCKLSKADTGTQNQLEGDLQKILEENDRFVQQIQNDANEDLAIFYLVKHYKANLHALEFINHKLGNYIEC
ncbi:MAG: hypothetical protein LBO74_18175 [Candidatus Symbiothrix sp.]|jgi:hypothetical protein|nr:hypothetical protein [Candidatus Symbiothrix sp.]